MAKFKVSGSEISFFEEVEVEAKNKEYALDKYASMISNGEIIVVDSDTGETKIKEV